MKPNLFRVDPSVRAPKIERLASIIRDPRSMSEEYIRAIRELAATGHHDAPHVIGSLLERLGNVCGICNPAMTGSNNAVIEPEIVS